MRFVPALILLAAAVSAGAEPPAPRPDGNGDPLPLGAVARLGSTRFLLSDGSDIVRDWRFRFLRGDPHVALAPDGKTLATAVYIDKMGTRMSFLDAATGRSVRTFDVPEVGGIRDGRLQFSADGTMLVFYGWSSVKLVEVATGKIARSIDLRTGSEAAVAQTADGAWVAAQKDADGYHAPVGIWETKTGKEVATLPGRGASCKGLAFGPDGQRLLLWSIVPTQADARSRSFGPESKAAVVCLDVKNRKILAETTLGSGRQVALGPDGETVALEADDQLSVRLRHLPSGMERCAIPVKRARFAFVPDGTALVAFDEGGRGALWDAAKGAKIRDLDGALANKDFAIIGVSREGNVIAALDGGYESAARIVVWDAATGKRVSRPAGHEGTVTCLAYAADGTALVSGSIDKTVRLWNPPTGEHQRILTIYPEPVTAVALSPDGKLVASSCQTGVIRVCSRADGKVLLETKGPAKGATTLTFSADSTVLFAGGDAPEILAWEVVNGKQAVKLATGQKGAVLAFSPGGDLAVIGNDGFFLDETPERLQVWSPKSNVPVATANLRSDKDGMIRCASAIFAPCSRLLASSQVSEYQGIRPSYGNARVTVWERVSGQPIRTLAPSITGVLAFSPDGRLLAAGAPGRSGHLTVGYGNGLDIWDTLTGKRAGDLAITPRCVAFSPDGRHLATGGADHSVLIWEAPKVARPDRAPAFMAAESDAWWQAFGGAAADAYKAMDRMIEVPDHAVAALKERVRPVEIPDADVVAKLIGQLDSQTFNERMEAQNSLEKMGEGAAHYLKKALDGKTSLELRRRLEALLDRCAAASPASLQQHRSGAVLEWIGTPAARELLRTLAKGAPGARLTIEAQAGLKRLKD